MASLGWRVLSVKGGIICEDGKFMVRHIGGGGRREGDWEIA